MALFMAIGLVLAGVSIVILHDMILLAFAGGWSLCLFMLHMCDFIIEREKEKQGVFKS